MENNKNDKLHVLSFNDKNIFLDDQKLEGVKNVLRNKHKNKIFRGYEY